MRSGVTLAQLRKEVQIETGQSTAAGHALQNAERIDHMLNRIERQLEMEHSWPTMRVERSVSLLAEAQTGTLPADLSFTNISQVWTAYGSDWVLMKHGIGPDMRTRYGTGYRASPLLAWEIANDGTTFEVWPRSPQAETVKFDGTLQAGAMTQDSHVCKLDGDVLVLYVAAEMLAKGDPATAEMKLRLAANRIKSLLGRQVDEKTAPANLAGGRSSPRMRPFVDFIPPGAG